MTQVEPGRLKSRYRGVVYGLDVLDHNSVMAGTPVIVPNDYIGQTRQRGRARENQHRDTQPFSDLIVGSARVLWEGDCTDEELDAVEQRFIRDGVNRVRPRLNWVHNEDNAQQIPKWVQEDQRRLREPDWQPPAQRSRAGLLEWSDRPAARTVPERRVAATRTWRAWQVKAGLWSAAWVMTTAATLAGFQQFGVAGSWPARTLCACLAAAALLAWGLGGAPTTRRQWRKARRRGVNRWLRW